MDEPHRMSASYFGQEMKYTKRSSWECWRAGSRGLAATPHNGKDGEFQPFTGLPDANGFESRFREGVHNVGPSDVNSSVSKMFG